MILKNLRSKSNEKCLNRKLAKRQKTVNNRKIETLGIILDIDAFENLEAFDTLATTLNIHPNRIKVLSFLKTEKEHHSFWDCYFASGDFSWNGKTKNADLQSFLDTTFDALISYYDKNLVELKLATALSKAHFKIGLLQKDERLNDLIIKVEPLEFKKFEREILRYLTVLNKI